MNLSVNISNKYIESGWISRCRFPPFYIQLQEFGMEIKQRGGGCLRRYSNLADLLRPFGFDCAAI
jgi:hypothetical protein